MKRKKVVRRKKKSSRARKRSRKRHSLFAAVSWPRAILLLLLLFAAYVVYLDVTVRAQFDGRKWSVPARVYARPLELYVGKPLSHQQLLYELKAAGYRQTAAGNQAGSFSRSGKRYRIVIRGFDFWDGHQPPRYIEVEIEQGFVTGLQDFRDNAEVAVVRLQPAIIGRIYPAHQEDRILVKLDEVPQNLIDALLVVEDRQFYQHHGINFRAIARAMLANIRAGGIVQGGSTLTQQLVKNFFLTRKKSLLRKVNEALMAVLLELHYSKKEILQAYMNEIYLGQDERRAIHGFALASHFYFDTPLHSLNVAQSTLLVALVRGPSYYDPWRHGTRLLQRRNHIIDLLQQYGKLSSWQARVAKKQGLQVVARGKKRARNYPAFMGLLRQQLRQDYNAEDLSSEGLRIFSTLDPYIQKVTEQQVRSQVAQLDSKRGLQGKLQAAVVITNINSAEVVAVVGDRNPAYAGFNRAVDALRPVGSLIKPAIYLTALQQSGRYTLASLIDDKPLTLEAEDGTRWSPRNYSGRSHGTIPLYKGLISSYNQATVRLGLSLGFESIAETLHKLGVKRDIPPYPSMLLGAVAMSPLQVSQMYHSLAAEGFVTPLRTIEKVMTADGKPLKHYAVNVRQGVDATSVRILNSALHEVTRLGTARSLQWRLPRGLQVAGKTGTTNDTRDSWFAGFSTEHLIVGWLGTDDNLSTGLTGASGALPLWAGIMNRIRTRPLTKVMDEELVYLYVEPVYGHEVDKDCTRAAYLAFRRDGVLPEQGGCQ